MNVSELEYGLIKQAVQGPLYYQGSNFCLEVYLFPNSFTNGWLTIKGEKDMVAKINQEGKVC